MSGLTFDPSILSAEDRDLAIEYVSCCLPHPNVILAPDGEPYLYRWHLAYNNARGNVFLHVQVKSDPERPLHDHPWDNTSVILAYGYDESYDPQPWIPSEMKPYNGYLERELRKGDMVYRSAGCAHRLILPDGVPYAMTLFSTGPNASGGGTRKTPCHIDMPMRGCTITLDGVPVVVDGALA